jgi:hypothetical protein
MAKADYRTKAGECYRMAAMAPSLADQATWLKLASEWLAMSSGGGVPVLTGSTVIRQSGLLVDDDFQLEEMRGSSLWSQHVP